MTLIYNKNKQEYKQQDVFSGFGKSGQINKLLVILKTNKR